MQAQGATQSTNSIAEKTIAPLWPVQGAWRYKQVHTLADDGRRYELIHGTLYAVAPPNFAHHVTSGELYFHLQRFVDQRALGLVDCAPCELHLPVGGHLLQPDVVVWNERAYDFDGRVYSGVPALIVEVVAANSQHHDRVTKFDLYEAAGVTEYWLADLTQCAVEVYTLAQGEYALAGHYTNNDAIQSPLLPGLTIRNKLLFNL